jgi:hypothetical protein
LEVRRIRSEASRYRRGDVVWLDFAASYKHVVVHVTVTSARTDSIVPAVGAPLPLHGTLAMESEQSKLDVDLRTSSCLGTPSTLSPLMTITPLLLRMGAGWLMWQLTLWIPWPYWWELDVSQAWVRFRV